MAAYKTRWFDRWESEQGLTTASLCAAVAEMAAGLYEADLGGGLLKKRIERGGRLEEAGCALAVIDGQGACSGTACR